MSPQARKLRKREVEAGIKLRRLLIQRDADARALAREGLIYTPAGVLDMTRRRIAGPNEETVGWIGGARAW